MRKTFTRIGLTLSVFLTALFSYAQPFVTQWDLSKTGSGEQQIEIAVGTNGVASYQWATFPTASATGTGTFSGFYLTITDLPLNAKINLSISGTNFNAILMNYSQDASRLINIAQWGNVVWSDMNSAFFGCDNLQISATDVPNLTNVRNMSSMFMFCTNLNSPTNIGSWNVSKVRNMDQMFQNAQKFNQPIGNWNTLTVVSFRSMFQEAAEFNQPINGWNTTQAQDMSNMFYQAAAFNQPIGSWNTGNVTNMNSMFYQASSFNQPLNTWNTGNVTNMNQMFNEASVFNQPLGNWNVSKVTNFYFMFRDALAFNQDLGSWNVSSATTMNSMFFRTLMNKSLGNWGPKLKSNLDLNGFLAGSKMSIASIDSTLEGFGLTTATGVIFSSSNVVYCKATAAVDFLKRATSAGGKGWTITLTPAVPPTITSQPTSKSIAKGESTIISIAASGTAISYLWNTGATTTSFTTSTAGIYIATVSGCGSIVSNPATVNVTVPAPFVTKWNMNTAGSSPDAITFNAVTIGPVSYQWSTIPATATGVGTFSGFTISTIAGLPVGAMVSISIFGENFSRFFIDNRPDRNRLVELSQWGVVNWTRMNSMFRGCNNLQITATDMPLLNSVTDVSFLFNGCSSIITVPNLENWDVSKITNMGNMFNAATKFNQNISGWNTGSVTDMNSMFISANAFNQDISTWNTSKVTNFSFMFYNNQIFNSPIGAWNMSSAVNLNGMFWFASKFNQNISVWVPYLKGNVDVGNLLNSSGLSATNYDNLLQSFSTSTLLGRNLGATDMKYCNSTARNILTTATTAGGKGWTITGDAVSTPPVLVTQPVSQTVLNGTPAIFTVSVVGASLRYVWSNGLSTTNTMTTNTAGSYSVTSFNGCGTVTSNVVTNTVIYSPSDYFITLWNMDTLGINPGELKFNPTIDVSVPYYWSSVPASVSGSGILYSTSVLTGLPTSGLVSVSILGNNLKSIYLATSNDRNRLMEISQWGIASWTNMNFSYAQCKNLQITSTDVPNLTNVNSMNALFASCTKLNGPANINSWNVSNVTDFSACFSEASSFNQPLGNWNVGNGTNFTDMFSEASSFNQPIGNWDVSKATRLLRMFKNATSFNQPIGNWNTKKVELFRNMFENAVSFNQPLNGWDFATYSLMDNMFLNAKSFDQNLGAWGSKFTNFHNISIFGLLDSSGISRTNYELTLQGLANASTFGISFSAKGAKYCAGNSARSYLTTSINSGGRGWDITGDQEIPTPSILIQPVSQVVCPGASAVFAVSASGSNLSYAWSNGSANAALMSTSTPGTYTVTVSGVCGSTPSNAFALVSTVCGGNPTFTSSTIVFTNTTPSSFTGSSGNLTWPTLSGAATYCIRYSKTRNFSTTVVTVCGLNAANYLFVLSTAGLRTEAVEESIYYQVAGVDANGNMSQWSDVMEFILNAGQVTSADAPNAMLGTEMQIFPNPSSGSFTIYVPNTSDEIQIFNAQGQLVLQRKPSANTTAIEAPLVSGIYLVKAGNTTKRLEVR